MPTGRRARFGGRGREWAWWVSAAAVLCRRGRRWPVLEWPAAAWLACGVAAAAALVVSALRARFKQDDTRAALVTKSVAVPSRQNRLPLVREAGLAQLRVHAAQVQVPYVERDVQQQVAAALGWGRSVLLVGHSMAGKTRLAAQVMRQRFPDAPLLIPESGKALRELVGEGLDPAGVVVWLDDLERFLGPDGLTMGLLTRLASGKAILVATIRSQVRETYRPRNELRPPEWEVLEAFTQHRLEAPPYRRRARPDSGGGDRSARACCGAEITGWPNTWAPAPLPSTSSSTARRPSPWAAPSCGLPSTGGAAGSPTPSPSRCWPLRPW